MIIAIDGPAGSGKTTTARKVAQRLGFIHINTGAMYRGITLKFIREKVNLDDPLDIDRILHNTQLNFESSDSGILYMDGEDISSEITLSYVTANVSRISAISNVRKQMVEFQRDMAQERDVVLEGRDIGTVVFPNADYKFYLVADIRVRAARRKKEIESSGEHITMEEVILFLKDRDRQDSSRHNSPLTKAEDAIELDTTDLNIVEQVNHILNIVN